LSPAEICPGVILGASMPGNLLLFSLLLNIEAWIFTTAMTATSLGGKNYAKPAGLVT
jgi:hypothetical protein